MSKAEEIKGGKIWQMSIKLQYDIISECEECKSINTKTEEKIRHEDVRTDNERIFFFRIILMSVKGKRESRLKRVIRSSVVWFLMF